MATLSSQNLTTLYYGNGNVAATSNVSGQNLTTLYTGTNGTQVIPTGTSYGNANVSRFLGAGTDGGNSVENIIARGAVVIGGGLQVAGTTTLSDISNVHISGGSLGEFLVTDGAGNLTWQTIELGNIQPVISFAVNTNGNNQSFTNANLATFPDNTYASVFRNGVLVEPTDFTIVGNVLTINNYMLSGDVVDVAPTGVGGNPVTGNIGNVNLNGNINTFLNGTGTWSNIAVPTGNISNVNLNGNTQTYLNGSGAWANIAVPTGNISNINLSGDGTQWLRGNGVWSNIAVPTGNIANTNYNGNTQTYLNGAGSWVSIATGGGNIGNVNLNGNAQTYLNGTGAWAAITSGTGNIGNINLNGNSLQWLRGNGTWANIAIPTGNIANTNLNGDGTTWLRGNGTWANIVVPTGNIGAVNLNGVGTTYLAGNGTWATIDAPTGNIGNVNLNGNNSTYLTGTGNWVSTTFAPAGTDNAIQYNEAGALAGNATRFSYDSGTGIVTTSGNTGSSSQFVVIDYGVTSTADGDFTTLASRGNITNPAALQVGDSLASIQQGAYTGNGSITVNSTSGWVTMDLITSNVAALPSSSGYRPASNTYIKAMGTANVNNQLVFDYSGNLTAPASVIAPQYHSVINTSHDIALTALTYASSLDVANVTADFVGISVKGTSSAPTPLAVGDVGAFFDSVGYSGNGIYTIDGQAGLAPMGSLYWTVTGLPAANQYSYTSKATISTTNGTSNTYNSAVFEAGNITIKNGSNNAGFFNGNILATSAPSTSSSAGVPGQIAYDGNFVYICTAVNTWKRSALTTF